MEVETYEHLEETLGLLNEMHLEHIKTNGSCTTICSKARTELRKAIAIERTNEDQNSSACA